MKTTSELQALGDRLTEEFLEMLENGEYLPALGITDRYSAYGTITTEPHGEIKIIFTLKAK
jgi:hypothetical protein